ncbi:hypothetical protein KCU79_g22754, partial [Aureobasidium melanogenum]
MNSLRGDETIFSALKASRETEHPLAQSVTVSPEQGPNRDAYFSSLSTPTGATDYPSQGDRSRSIMSTTTSVRTIKPSDTLVPQITPESPPASPGLGSSSFDTTVTNIGGLLSGAGRRILKSVRDRSTAGRSTDGLERSISRAPSESSDAHADPSVAHREQCFKSHSLKATIKSGSGTPRHRDSPKHNTFSTSIYLIFRGTAAPGAWFDMGP